MPRDPVDRHTLASLALVLAGTLTLGACAGDPAGPDADDGVLPLEGPGLHLRTLEVGGVPRRYRVYRPADMDEGSPLPVVVVLHGFPPVDMAAVTGMQREADARGFVAVYPESAWGEDWVQGCACTPNGLRGIDDLAFFAALLDHVARVTAVDPNRRYVTGFSNGGMMTYRLACDRPGLFAGYAAVGAAVWTWHRDHCGAGPAVPLLMIHGTQDPSFPWSGTTIQLVTGATMRQLSLDEHQEWWADRQGCVRWSETALPDTADDGTRVFVRHGEGCDAPTRFYRIEGGGHTWPGMGVSFSPTLGLVSREVDATALVASFFLDEG